MIRRLLTIGSLGFALFALAGCYFSQYAQETELETSIDSMRTGCEIDTDTLMAEYKQYDANRLHFGSGATPTPGPIDDNEFLTMALLEMVWENGCETGRRDAVGAEQASLMGLRDQLQVLQDRIDSLEEDTTPTATPIATPTPDEE